MRRQQQQERPGVVYQLIEKARIRLLTLPRGAKQTAMLGFDVASYLISAIVSYWIVYGTLRLDAPVLAIATLAIVVSLPLHWVFGFYASIVRYVGLAFIVVGLQATFVVTATLMTLSAASGFLSAPIRMGVIFWSFSLICIVGGRLVARLFLSRRNQRREPVIVYGAGSGGVQLIAALLSADDYLPVAIVDDNRELHGSRVQGIKVHSPESLKYLVQKTGARGVLLAIPSATRQMRREVLERVCEFPVHVRTMPGIRAIVSGEARADELSDVDVEDLLGRDPVPPDSELMAALITAKNVMVTGAGGSIGTELCRQILKLQPTRLICFEMAEPALYSIDKELRRIRSELSLDCDIIALLGSVGDEPYIREAMRTFGVHTVYHAAAYKHVPIVEQNLFSGIRNNVFGTLCAAQAAEEARVENFVLVSTDKAVNPTSVMGATKRLSELILQAFHTRKKATRFCIVRFGNVLESSGSVVPLFREQIRAGGPVTVTHRDIIRYFMTIPEAAQLVIQAGSMARGGDVFVLDMGAPVRIEDLARRMISLMGKTIRDDRHPDGDIEIEFIGLRPAEKLYEELLIGSNVEGTEHARIMRADEDYLPMKELLGILKVLEHAVETSNYQLAREILRDAVVEYMPGDGIDDLVWASRTGTGAQTNDGTIIDFPGPESHN